MSATINLEIITCIRALDLVIKNLHPNSNRWFAMLDLRKCHIQRGDLASLLEGGGACAPLVFVIAIGVEFFCVKIQARFVLAKTNPVHSHSPLFRLISLCVLCDLSVLDVEKVNSNAFDSQTTITHDSVQNE